MILGGECFVGHLSSDSAVTVVGLPTEKKKPSKVLVRLSAMSSIEENVDALLDESLLAKVTSSNNQSRLQAHDQLFAILQVFAESRRGLNSCKRPFTAAVGPENKGAMGFF